MKLSTARWRVVDIAIELAKDGLSADTIRAALLDMADGASKKAEAFIARYEAEEARAAAIDREDADEESDARAEELRGRENAHLEAGQ